MKTALVTIASPLEKNYINEWIKYHHSLGFDDIFVYTNNWRMPLESSYVHLVSFDGTTMQLNAYSHFMKTYATEYDWILTLDCDEFLVTHNISISQLFTAYDKYYGCAFNWRIFGSNGLRDMPESDFSVLKRFTRCEKSLNHHVKTALNIKKINDNGITNVQYVNPHFTNLFKFNVISNASQTAFVHGPFNDQLYDPDKFPYIAHFFCKSLEEYRQRRSRGRPDLPSDSADFIRPETQFWDHDKNEVECLELYNLFRRIV